MAKYLLQRQLSTLIVAISLSALGIGCASVDVTGINRTAPDHVQRPDRVLIYDVATTVNELPQDSSLRADFAVGDREQSDDDIELGRELGALIAKNISEQLSELGLPSVRATGWDAQERPNDIVIRGGFVEIDDGNVVMRSLVGFGAGSTELQTHFEVYHVTPYGRTPLGTAGIEAAGGHMPGILLSMGIGGVAKGAVVGGTLAAGREFTSESIQGAAKRTADEFVETLKPGLVKRGWIKED